MTDLTKCMYGMVCLAVCCGTAFGGAAWRGTVVDARTGESISGVTVTAGIKGRSGPPKAVSGDDGTFVVKYSDYDSKNIAKNGVDYYLRTATNWKEFPYVRQHYRTRLLPEHLEVRLMPFHVHFKGRVVDAETGEPIAGVRVTLLPAERGLSAENTTISGPDGSVEWKPLYAFNQLSPRYEAANEVPEAFRDPVHKVLEPLHYGVGAYAEGYKALAPVAVPGARPKQWVTSLPTLSSRTDAIHTWVDIRMVKGKDNQPIDFAKQIDFRVRGAVAEKPKLPAGETAQKQKQDAARKALSSGDHATAVRLYRELVEEGDLWGHIGLGMAYFQGHGVERDKTQGVALFRRAAEGGSSRAQYNLGWALLRGEGVARNDDEAVEWLFKSADQGNASALNELGALYAKGRAVPKNLEIAIGLYRRAAEQGNASAQCNLGYVYLVGQGVPQDDAEALRWFLKGAAGGNEQSKAEADKLTKAGVKPPPSSPRAKPEPALPPPAKPPVVAPKPPVAPPTTSPPTAKGPERAPPQPPASKKRSPVPKPPLAKEPDYSAYTVVHDNHPYGILKVKNGLFVLNKQKYTPIRNGKKHGVETVWRLKGDPLVRDHITRTTTYKDGVRHGEQREYYPDGMLRELRNYVDGKLQGTVQEFYESGALKEMYNVKDDLKHGLYESYWESGPIMREAMYFEGKLDDFEKRYREDGRLLKHTSYTTGGKMHGEYWEYNPYNGSLLYRRMYNNDIIVWSKQYHRNGVLERHTPYDPKGKRSGVETYYFGNGVVMTMVRYENGDEVSRREFDVEGKPMEE